MGSSSGTTDGRISVPTGLPPGFRFSPTDEELVDYYLKKKMDSEDSEFSHFIPEINVREREPRDLPEYFFSQPDRMPNSESCNRTTKEGFYRITGKVREIKVEQSQAVIGEKRYMSFYKGRTPHHKKTTYVLHECSLTKTELAKLGPNPNQQREFVLNHLTKSVNSKKRSYDSICDDLAEPSHSKDDQAAAATNTIPEPKVHFADEDVLLGSENRNECTESESANGSCLIDINDFSTGYVCSPGGGFSSGSENLPAYNAIREVSFQTVGNLISPIQLSSLHDIRLGSNGSCLIDVNEFSTGYVGSPGGGFSSGSENLCEAIGNLISPIQPSSLQDIPLRSNGSCLIDVNEFSTGYVGSPSGDFFSGSENLCEASFQTVGNLISPLQPSSLPDIPMSNGSCLIDTNEFSTGYVGSPSGGFSSGCENLREASFQTVGNLISPIQPSSLQDIPLKSNGSRLIDINDFSTGYVGLPGGGFSSGSENLREVSFQTVGNLISPIQPSSLQNIPLRSDGSCHIDISYFSTGYVGSPGGGYSSGSENLAANNPIREVSFQPEGNPISTIHPSSLRAIPSRSSVPTGLLGDVVYANNSIPIGMQLLGCCRVLFCSSSENQVLEAYGLKQATIGFFHILGSISLKPLVKSPIFWSQVLALPLCSGFPFCSLLLWK